MWIEYDFDFSTTGDIVAIHRIDSLDPLVIEMLSGLDAGTIDMTASGWGEMSSHPDYPGKTRYEVVKAEMARRANE